MAKKVVPPKSVDELFEDLSTLKLKIALLEDQEDELDRYTEACDSDEQMEALALRGEQRMLKHINRGYRKSQTMYAVQRTIPRIVRVAASILLFCYIGLTVAIAADSSVRIKVMEFILNIEEEYTEFGFVDTGEYMDVPTEWQGYYYPASLPDGFSVQSVMRYAVHFVNNEGVQLDFMDIDAEASTAIDTENAEVKFISVNGHSALLVEKDPWISIIWSVDNRVLMVNYAGDLDSAIQIAESVRMIR
ncbi:MAG: DUF4367 domain-containing protein [Oscillospiraceae bacterium]|nr:DUF4367 domain-containing protein [Clostridia bacterium]MBQ9167460.1 DUF4367 domain-containing protein [Oscillospiraceae bacterium]